MFENIQENMLPKIVGKSGIRPFFFKWFRNLITDVHITIPKSMFSYRAVVILTLKESVVFKDEYLAVFTCLAQEVWSAAGIIRKKQSK